MKKMALGIVLAAAAALFMAQSPGQIKLQSLVGPLGIASQGHGPTSAYIPVNGGTMTCNGASTVTTANTNIDAGSIVIFTLKTVGGTVGAYPTIKTITAGTGFTSACTASDTSIYNYVILG